jgi:hypothetical protein
MKSSSGRQHKLFTLTEDQLEHVVEHKVLAAGVAGQLEGLGVVHRALLLIDKELAGDKDEDATLGNGGLGIEGGNLVLDLLERQSRELLSNVLSTEDRSGLEGQHGLLAVERDEALAIGVEGVVVELDELLCSEGVGR